MDKKQFSEAYRPKYLAKVVGQEQAVAQIEGMLKHETIPSTVLLAGPSESGKTSLARLIANLITNNKPGKEHPDIHEESLGNERGIDFVREIVARAKYMPRVAPYSVFIIDEIAKATPQAFSPMLKLLEEPPKQTVFLLCTDEPQRLPNTILNRCYKIQLKPLTKPEIKLVIKRVIKLEKIDITKLTIKKIVNHATGPRDALQILQAVRDVGSDKASINGAILTASNNTGFIAVKILVGIYNKKPTLVFTNLLLDKDNVDLLNQLLFYNEWLIKSNFNVKIWQNQNTLLFKKNMNESPKLDRLTHLHNILVNLRQYITTVSTNEQKHALLARLGSSVFNV